MGKRSKQEAPIPGLIGVASLQKHIEVSELSTRLEEDRPLSVLLIAKSGAGKSRIVLKSKYAGAGNVRVLSDLSGMGFLEQIEASLGEGKFSGMYLIPDLNAALSHKNHVTGYTFGVLLGLLGEGLVGEVALPGVEKRLERIRNSGVKVAIIACVTPEMVFRRSGHWKALGLFRRLLPMYYTYSAGTVSLIQQALSWGGSKNMYEMTREALPLCSFRVDMQAIRAEVIQMASNTMQNMRVPYWTKDGQQKERNTQDFPFDIQNGYFTYARAHRVWRLLNDVPKSKKYQNKDHVEQLAVGQEELEALRDLSRFVSYQNPVAL